MYLNCRLIHSLRAAIFGGLLVLATPASPQNTLEIIPLRHRTAEQVLPVLRALVEPGATLTGQGTQLIVRASPGNLDELRRALEAIDRPARRLQISVRLDEALDSAARGVEAGGRVSSSGSRIDIRADDRQSATAGRADQFIQVLEGGRAFIATGQSTPILDASVLRETASGFEVVPRLAGDTVLLDIAQRRETAAQQQALSTSVSGRLGEWLEVGGAVEDASRDSSGLASRGTNRTIGSRRVWLKVEELRP